MKDKLGWNDLHPLLQPDRLLPALHICGGKLQLGFGYVMLDKVQSTAKCSYQELRKWGARRLRCYLVYGRQVIAVLNTSVNKTILTRG